MIAWGRSTICRCSRERHAGSGTNGTVQCAYADAGRQYRIDHYCNAVGSRCLVLVCQTRRCIGSHHHGDHIAIIQGRSGVGRTVCSHVGTTDLPLVTGCRSSICRYRCERHTPTLADIVCRLGYSYACRQVRIYGHGQWQGSGRRVFHAICCIGGHDDGHLVIICQRICRGIGIG